MSTSNLQRLDRAKEKAARQLQHKMAEMWPENSEILVYLSTAQKHPSEAKVLGYFDGRIRVQLKKNPNTIKRVHWRNAIWIGEVN